MTDTDAMPPREPAIYDAVEVDEMGAAGLAVLDDLRQRLAADLAWTPQIARRVLALVDERAAEIAYAHSDLDDEEPS